ncbi:MAG: Ig-like domain-containing protein [Treponema sp.]|nr:Ig-like domain-containing protein [Treponema sp.]
MDLRGIGLSVSPGKSGKVLPDEYSPVVLSFDTEMRKEETESILQINSDTGSVTGDCFWKDKQLFFVPSPPWTAGTRYVLNLSGTVYSMDGRELRLERYISFFAINKSEAPGLEWFSPADGESVEAGALRMELRFSLPMEISSVESAFAIDGAGEKRFEWSDDDRVLKVTTEKALLPWTAYHWNLNDSAKSRDGVPLTKKISAQFSTDLDKLVPRVLRVYPVISSDGRWLPTGSGIEEGLGPGQGILVEFNKPMGENVLRSLRFDPNLAGRTESLSDKSIVFIPSRDPEPETAYTLVVSADTRDSGGLKLGEDYHVTFIPDIPFLRILSFNVEGAAVSDFDNNSTVRIPLDSKNQGILRFTIRFSLPFSDEAKQNTALLISLNPYFPETLDSTALRSVTWQHSDDLLTMEWERLKAGSADEAHFYRLLIPGGKGGINNGGSMYFKEDQVLYLEAVQ